MAFDDFYDATGPHHTGFLTFFDPDEEDEPFPFGGVLYGRQIGLLGLRGLDAPNQQNGYTQRSGVQGASDPHTGVAGISRHAPGVFGQVDVKDSDVIPTGLVAGVIGAAEAQPGVIGFSRSSDGVEGASFEGTAIRGVSFFGPAVQAVSGALSGVTGISGTQGPPIPNQPATIAGVVGTSSEQTGVIGTSDTFVGVHGFSNNVGVVGQSTNPASFAGLFVGNVGVTGTLTAAVKNAVVAFPDGTRRVLHCMESPEHWFEDFGTATLKSGRAVVRLDANFAKVIRRGDYHVFLTPKGDCGGLYVRQQRGASFDVRELGGGASSVAFSYRIVGRRKDIKAHRRFARFDARPPLPASKRPPKPTAAALRTFIRELEKEARKRAPKGAARPRTAEKPLRFVSPTQVRAGKR